MNININSLKAFTIHVLTVQQYMLEIIELLQLNSIYHDSSKYLNSDEWALLQHKYLLDSLEYGSSEFNTLIEELKPSVDEHHYNNRHHIEFHEHYLQMSMFDWLEWLADLKSFESNNNFYNMLQSQFKKYEIDKSTQQLLTNTATELGWM